MVMGTRNTINANFGKENDMMWWANSATYTVYDDFTGADSSAWNAAKWTVAGGTINIQSNRGSIVCTATTGTATSNALPIGTDIYAEIYSMSNSRPNLTESTTYAGVNGVAYITESVGAGGTAGISTNYTLLIKYCGGTTYQIFINGKYTAEITSASAPTIFFQGVSTTYSGFNGVASLIVDNVRYR